MPSRNRSLGLCFPGCGICFRWGLLLACLLLAGLGCLTAPAQRTAVIKIDGSSTVAPLTESAAEEFMRGQRGVRVTVGTSGTGGGFKKFTAPRGTDVSDASRPIAKKEMAEAKKNGIEFIELPVSIDAITVVVNKGNTFVDYLTVDELKKMWSKDSQNSVTKWSDIRKGWPDEKFALFGPGTDSGTFDYFTEAINGKSGNSRSDYSASEDDNTLVTGVSGDPNGLGYFGYAYYDVHKEKLRAVPIKGKTNSEPIEPGPDTIRGGAYSPLSRPLFIYVNRASAERAEVKEFVEFYLRNAPVLARRKGYVALPREAYPALQERFAKLQTGTAFGGKPEAGLSIAEILKRGVR